MSNRLREGCILLDVLIRKVSPVLVDKLDVKARERGMSREEFLREQLEVIAYVDLLAEHRKEVNGSLGKVADSFEIVSEKLSVMEEEYERLVYLISYVTEIDLQEMEEFIKEQMEGRKEG